MLQDRLYDDLFTSEYYMDLDIQFSSDTFLSCINYIIISIYWKIIFYISISTL